jgi:hypothetical protein
MYCIYAWYSYGLDRGVVNLSEMLFKRYQRGESNQINSNRIESNRIESNRIESKEVSALLDNEGK